MVTIFFMALFCSAFFRFFTTSLKGKEKMRTFSSLFGSNAAGAKSHAADLGEYHGENSKIQGTDASWRNVD
jgi:hypothetical protein